MKSLHNQILIAGSLILTLTACGDDQNAQLNSSTAPTQQDLTMNSQEAQDFVTNYSQSLLNDLDKGPFAQQADFSGRDLGLNNMVRALDPHQEHNFKGFDCRPKKTAGSDADADADNIKDSREMTVDCDVMVAGNGVKLHGKTTSLDKDTADQFGGFTVAVDPFHFEVGFPKDGLKYYYLGDFMTSRDVAKADHHYDVKDRLNVDVTQKLNGEVAIHGSLNRQMDMAWDGINGGDMTEATLANLNGQIKLSLQSAVTGPLDYALTITGGNLTKGGCQKGFKTGEVSFTDSANNVLKAVFTDCKGEWTFNGRSIPLPVAAH